MITSPQNPLVRHVVRLRDNRYRQRAGEVLVDGLREIERAAAAGLSLKQLFVTSPYEAPPDETLQRLLSGAGSRAVAVPARLMQRIGFGSPRGAVGIFEQAAPAKLESLTLSASPLVVVLVGVEKPGNAGAVFRSADAMAADAVILCDPLCDLFNPNLIRASLGTVFTVPALLATEAETCSWLQRRGIARVTTIVGATRVYWDVDYRGPTAIVMGAESSGLGPRWAEGGGLAGSSVRAVSIPMLGAADSLNVSVAAAALLLEARRQRTIDGSGQGALDR